MGEYSVIALALHHHVRGLRPTSRQPPEWGERFESSLVHRSDFCSAFCVGAGGGSYKVQHVTFFPQRCIRCRTYNGRVMPRRCSSGIDRRGGLGLTS